MVADLLDHEQRKWNHVLISQLFDPRDAELILQIPVSINFKDDWFWNGDIRGQYSVKDGYRCQGELTNTPKAVWNNIWKLIRVPPKWRIFLWKALSNILPTITNLVRRRVEIPNICPACGDCEEDVMHILCTCVYARRVWNVSRLLIPNVDNYDFMQWVEAWLGCSATSAGFLKEQICGILYEIWRSRNMAVWDSFLPTPTHLCHTFHGYWFAYSTSYSPIAPAVPPAVPQLPTVQALPATLQPAAVLPVALETPLPPGGIYCFTDAGFHGASPSYGFFACNAHGGLEAAANEPLICPNDPLLAEAMAVREALSWLRDHGFQNVAVYSDCAVLVSSFRDVTTYRSYLGIILDSCLQLFRSFHSCSIKFVRRDANTVAHALAKHSSAIDSHSVWRDYLPSFVSLTV
ncbi:PREDICTED: uncharacterized protein LOC109190922 [Ipomoea nil]|uniref:uncharacterized protein LOC109190922 n=1 Tax=Ipomoea nil TaxID=35883 RepID=UPI000901EAD0|nr:PREDICTED: uncharacterized protein LOC109190922 [Ipomoea nil]